MRFHKVIDYRHSAKLYASDTPDTPDKGNALIPILTPVLTICLNKDSLSGKRSENADQQVLLLSKLASYYNYVQDESVSFEEEVPIEYAYRHTRSLDINCKVIALEDIEETGGYLKGRILANKGDHGIVISIVESTGTDKPARQFIVAFSNFNLRVGREQIGIL